MSRIVLALRTNMAEESGARFCEIFPFYMREVSFNLRIGTHKELSCATLKCKTNFNDGQRRNEVYDRLNGTTTWKLDKSIDKKCLQDMQEPRLDNMNWMCFAEVQVLKLLLEHGTY